MNVLSPLASLIPSLGGSGRGQVASPEGQDCGTGERRVVLCPHMYVLRESVLRKAEDPNFSWAGRDLLCGNVSVRSHEEPPHRRAHALQLLKFKRRSFLGMDVTAFPASLIVGYKNNPC